MSNNIRPISKCLSGFRKYFLLFPFSLLLVFSCTTQKQLTYLQDIDEAGPDNYFPLERPEYRLQKQDILYVNFVTISEEINTMLNSSTRTISQGIGQGQGSAYLFGYTIRDSGYITLPVIGNIYVLEKTMEEVTQTIEEKASIFLKDVSVVVKLLSYKITVLGEVKIPGTFSHFGNQLTVLEAIGMAGDLTDYGDRSHILVIHQTKEGSHTYRLDLKNKDLLISEGYFLLPNDIVIIEPRKVKFLTINTPTVSFFFSTIFSSISLTVLILTLL